MSSPAYGANEVTTRMTSPDTLYVTCNELRSVIIPVQPRRAATPTLDEGDPNPQPSGEPVLVQLHGLDQPQPDRSAGIGVTLTVARLRAGLTREDVSERTRITVARLTEFENDDYSGCGATVFARGRLNSMARAVGLDPAPLLAVFDAALEPDPRVAAAQPITEPSPWMLVLLGGLVVLMICPVTWVVVTVLGGG